MGEEIKLRYSPLCQTIERDDKSVEVQIYSDGEGGWLLEVVDAFGNSTVWNDPFVSDQEAFDEVLGCIKDECIDSLIVMPGNLNEKNKKKQLKNG